MSPTSSYNAPVAIPVLIIGVLALRVIYNLFLHPLRSYPGPILARSFASVLQIQRLRGNQNRWTQALHAQYGPIVRTGPNQISTIEPEVWKQAYGHKDANFPKDLTFYGPDTYGTPPGLIRADDVAHARQRKLVSHAFSDKALREQEQLLKGYAVLLANQLKKKAKDRVPQNMVHWYNFTTFDIMADLTFGEPLHLLDGNEYTPWVKAIFTNIRTSQLIALLREWPGFQTILTALIPRKMKEEQKKHMKYSVDRMEERLARDTDRPDIWTYIMRHGQGEENKGKNLLPTEMRSNASLFMVAGTETTATALSGLTYYLLQNPKKMERLTKEIRDAFPAYDDMNINELARLPYLNACVEEGLRIYPPVSIGFPRRTPKGGAEVGGRWIPGGTGISIPQLAAYHSPANFKDPDSFVPERWMPEGEPEYSSDRKEVLQPFSFGPRNCLGKNLAYHELRLIFATTLWYFDLELCPESEGWPDQDVYVLWDKHPLMCKLKNIRE